MSIRYVKVKTQPGLAITDRGELAARKKTSKKKKRASKMPYREDSEVFAGGVVLTFDDTVTDRNRLVASIELLLRDVQGSDVLE